MLQEFCAKVVKLVVVIAFNTILCKFCKNLSSSLKSFNVLVGKLLEDIDFIFSGSQYLLIQNFTISLDAFTASCQIFKLLKTVLEVIEFINSSWILSNNLINVFFLYINLALQKLNSCFD